MTVDGASAAQITERTPSIVLTPVPLYSDHVDQVCQAVVYDIVDSSLKDVVWELFAGYWLHEV